MVEKNELTPNAPDLWSQYMAPVRRFGERVAEFLSPSSEAATTDDYYEVTVELPGVSDEDITVEYHDGRLSVSGEKRSTHEEKGKNFYFSERLYGNFRRTFRLPDDADAEKILASHKDGVLIIKVAKLTPRAPKPKTIEISPG